VMAIARGESVRPGNSRQDSVSRRLTPRRRPQGPGVVVEQILSAAPQALPVVVC
jgi:hypothetical protein